MHPGPLKAHAGKILAGSLALMVGLATFHPGVRGDLLRGWIIVGAGGLLLLHAWHLRVGPESAPRDRPTNLLLIAFGVVLAVGLLQLLPLPRGLTSVLASGTATLYDLEDAASGGAAEARPVSIEPGATSRVIGLTLAYLLVFLAARRVGRDRTLAAHLALALTALGGAVALFALVNLANLPALDPWRSRAREPFVNPNHLCTYLTLSLGLALGLALAPAQSNQPRLQRGVAALSLVLMVVGLLASQSRAGVAAAGGAFVTALLLSGASGKRRWVGLGAGAGALLLGLALSDPEPLLERIEHAQRQEELGAGLSLGDRVTIWGIAGRVAASRPLLGAGLGTFDDASFAALDPQVARTTRPESAHNDYLELLATVGFPAGLAAIGCLLAAVFLIGRGVRDAHGQPRAIAAGAVAGLVGALLHEVFDFGLKIPGPALLACVCLGLATGLRGPAAVEPTPGAPRDAPPLKESAPRVALAVALLALGAALAWQASREAAGRDAFERIRMLRPALRAEAAKRALPPLRAASGWLARADAYYLRAQAARFSGRDNWMNEALESARESVTRAPGRDRHQMLLALLLLNRWDAQTPKVPALREEGEARLSLAVDLGPTNARVLLAAAEAELDLLVRTGDPARLQRAKALLTRVVLQAPELRGLARSVVDAKAARLGAAAAELRGVLSPQE